MLSRDSYRYKIRRRILVGIGFAAKLWRHIGVKIKRDMLDPRRKIYSRSQSSRVQLCIVLTVIGLTAGIITEDMKTLQGKQSFETDPFVQLVWRHFKEIKDYVQQVGAGKWRDVPRNLSIEEPTIENDCVDKDYSKLVAEKFYSGLITWMRSPGTQRAIVNTKKLCEALRLTGCSEALGKLLREGVEAERGMPAPRSKTCSTSLSSCHDPLLLAVLFMYTAAVMVKADMETFHARNQLAFTTVSFETNHFVQLVWRPFKEIKVSLANETEAFSFSSFDGDNEPVTLRHCRVIYQQVGAGKWKDVLRNLSIAEVAIENVDEENKKVAEKFYQGLLAWMRSCGTQRATTKKLCNALHLAGCSEALEKLLREISLANETEASRFSSLGSDNEPVTEIHCRCISQLVGWKWKDVLRNLSIAEVAIENVDEDNSTVAEKFYQGLLKWMGSCGTQRATTNKLCEALCLADCSEALEKLSGEGVTSVDAPAPIPESTVDLGTCM